MKMKHFLSAVEHKRLHAAIQKAEEGTSGDIVVFLTHKRVPDALAAAHDEFRKLRLEKAAAQNAILFYVAPESQTFAVVGGTALHHKVGQVWWEDMTSLLARHFRAGRFTEGLIAAVERAGAKLQELFPAAHVDRTGERDIVEE
jgi:uncharacterized membrane protein